jgi:hypothetical protein
MAATVQAALAVVKFYFLAAVLVVEAEMVLAAGRCGKVIWKFTFASKMRKQSTPRGKPLSSLKTGAGPQLLNNFLTGDLVIFYAAGEQPLISQQLIN